MFVTPTGLIMTMVAMPILTALTLGIAGVWLTGDLRVMPLVGLAATIVGAALVGYFNWRARFQRRILEDANDERHAV
jgi:hypothetical protein